MKIIKNGSIQPRSNIIIRDYCLGGFEGGDTTFSISNLTPRLKFENHIKELELFKVIKVYLNSGNLNLIKLKNNKNYFNSMVIL